MIFNGEGVQNITIPVYDSEGYNGRNMLGNVTINSAGLNIPGGATIYKLDSDLYIDGDTNLLNIHDWNGKNVEVNGSVSISDSDALLNPGENSVLKINEDLSINEGKLFVRKGRVEVGGTLNVNRYGKIVMDDGTGYLLVNKNIVFAIANANFVSDLYKGTIELKGDILWKENSYKNVWELFDAGWLENEGAECNINMIFNGEGVQNITIPVYDSEGYNGRNMLGNVTINSAGLNIPGGATIYKLDSDLYIDGDTNLLNIHDWNGYKIKLIGVPRDKVSSKLTLYYDGYGKMVTKNLNNIEKYDITYQPSETTYTAKFYVGSSLKKTQPQYCTNSLVEPYNVTLSDNQEFDGWYLDSAMTQKFDIDKDVITSDISLYGRIVNHVASVTLNKSEIVFDEVGSTDYLKATVLPSNATDKTVTWTVSDNSIVKVSDTGNVEALSAGSTTVKAKAGNCEAECKVVVKQKDIADVSVGAIADIEYTGAPQEVTPKLESNIRTLIPQEDYSVAYSEDTTNAGTITVTMKGIGNYCGTKQVTYEIVQATSVVNPVLSANEVFESDNLPTISTSKGDTAGTISFDEGQSLRVGTFDYAWTFTPDNANYKIVKGTIPVTVKAVEVESIYIAKQPDKLHYAVGETFDAEGLVVIAKYNNGTESEVTDYSVDLAEVELSLDHTKAKVSYIADGVIFTVDIPIEVFEQLSDNTDISAVMVREVYGTISGNSIEVVLPAESSAEVLKEDIAVYTRCPHASVENLQKNEENGSWLFTVLAQDRLAFTDYVLTVRFAESEEEYVHSQQQVVESAIDRVDFVELMQSVSQTEEGTNASVEEVINAIVGSINSIPEVEAAGITVSAKDVNVLKFETPVDGDADNPEGTEGCYSFEVSYEDENYAISSGTVEGVLESVPFSGLSNKDAVAIANSLLTTNDYIFAPANTAAQNDWIAEAVNQMNAVLADQELGIVVTADDISVMEYVDPKKGTVDNPGGQAGSITFTVALSKGKTLCDTEQITVEIPPVSIRAYTISATAGVGGTITPNGTSRVEEGDDLIYKIVPASGYNIKSIVVDGVGVGTVGSYSFKDVKGNHSITAYFEKESPVKENKKEALPKVGDLVKDTKKNAVWKITKVAEAGKTGSVEFVSLINKQKTKVTIPATVTLDGVKYEVTAIGKNAFKSNKKIKSAIIGSNVTTIGDKAFYKCTALTKITIPSKVKTIGKSAFYGCSKMKSLTIKSTKLTAKKIGSKAFGKTSKSMMVKIPKKKFKAYKSMLINKGVNKKAKFKNG